VSGYRRNEDEGGLMVGIEGLGIGILVAVVVAALVIVYLVARPRTH
jgi:hypothetical protein